MHIIDPHNRKSVSVKKEDANKVYAIAEDIFKLFGQKIGNYSNPFAIAHTQVEREMPLAFFVINPAHLVFTDIKSVVICNPRIVRCTKSKVDSEEGCMSFATMPKRVVQRSHKIEVEFEPLEFDENKQPYIGEKITVALSGLGARIFQHEIDHLFGKYIYEI